MDLLSMAVCFFILSDIKIQKGLAVILLYCLGELLSRFSVMGSGLIFCGIIF